MAFKATHIFWSKFVFSVTILFSLTTNNMWFSLKSVYICMVMAFRATHIFWFKFGYLVTIFCFLTKKYVVESKKCIWLR